MTKTKKDSIVKKNFYQGSNINKQGTKNISRIQNTLSGGGLQHAQLFLVILHI
jgi:hypothetical protein